MLESITLLLVEGIELPISGSSISLPFQCFGNVIQVLPMGASPQRLVSLLESLLNCGTRAVRLFFFFLTGNYAYFGYPSP